MDEVFRALADPTRRKILGMLDNRELSAGDIAKEFDMTAPSISHHLSVLKAADLVSGRRDGQQIMYSLNTTVTQDLLRVFMEVFPMRGAIGGTE